MKLPCYFFVAVPRAFWKLRIMPAHPTKFLFFNRHELDNRDQACCSPSGEQDPYQGAGSIGRKRGVKEVSFVGTLPVAEEKLLQVV
jgi:hypothetical protein